MRFLYITAFIFALNTQAAFSPRVMSVQEFVMVNYKSLIKDMDQGQGEVLRSLSRLKGIRYSKFKTVIKKEKQFLRQHLNAFDLTLKINQLASYSSLKK